MFLSREVNIKLCQNYTKMYICKMLYKICSIRQIIFIKYATNLKTAISQRSLKTSGLLLLLFEFNNFSFLIDIIDNSMSPKFQPIAVQYYCHISQSDITWPVYCSAIGGSSHVIRMYILHIFILVQFWHSFMLISRDRNIR